MLPRIVRLAALAATLAALAPSARAAGLSPLERRVASSVDRGTPSALALVERLVDVNSGTQNRDGVREVGRMIAPALDSLGFRTRWVDGAAWNRAGHLLGERPGRGARLRVLFIGHLDTVFERDSPFQRFERLTDSTARGPGASDMKGGDVVMLLALRALRDAGALDRFDVSVVLSGDEESAGSPLALARADLVAAARGRDVAIGFEDGAGDPATAVVSRRGAIGWTLAVSGTSAHSSQIGKPEVGEGAVHELARILAAFRDSLASEPMLTLNPGLVAGGTNLTLDADAARATSFGKSNVVADTAVATGDLRTLTPDQLARAEATMRRIVAAHLPRTSATLAFDEGYPPLAPTEANARLLQVFDGASRDLGLGPVSAVAPDRAGAADISFVSGEVGAAMDGVGMMGSGGHTIGETADLRSLNWNAKRVAITLLRFAASRGR